MTSRRLLGCAVTLAAWSLLVGGGAGATRKVAAGSVTEVPVGVRSHSYLFGLTTGPDGAVWFADLSCTGLGHCAIDRLDRGDRVSEYRRGLDAGSVPYTIAAGPDGNLWFDEGKRPASAGSRRAVTSPNSGEGFRGAARPSGSPPPAVSCGSPTMVATGAGAAPSAESAPTAGSPSCGTGCAPAASRWGLPPAGAAMRGSPTPRGPSAT